MFIKYFFLLLFLIPILMTAQNTKLSLNGGFVDGKYLLTVRMNEKIDILPTINDFSITSNDGGMFIFKSVEKSGDPFECKITLNTEINIKKEYFVTFNGVKKRLVMNNIYQDPKYYNLNAELGAIYSTKKTIFRLYAPRATEVKVLIYDNPVKTTNEKCIEYSLTEKNGGVWEASVTGNFEAKYYTYKLVSVSSDCNKDLEVIDPYAKIITRGDGQNVIRKSSSRQFDQTLGRGIIVNFKNTKKVESLKGKYNKIEDAIIWETHTRDLTMGKNSGIPENIKGSFSGASFSGAKYKNFKTGVDHIEELGATVVQFLPVNEFVVGNETDFKHKFINFEDQKEWPTKRYYDWGYGPINYFSPEGWYASNTDDYSRIIELKNMISEFHKKGIRVTLDVVFNHTFEGSRKQPNIYLFRGIDSDHYYRSAADETFYDGIYCQNELRTENPMVAKYIIDCLKYWMIEFKVDGFRFDWMSALDPNTMANMVNTLRKINPNVLLYGELWTLRGLSYSGKNNGTYVDRQHIGLFEKDYNLPSGSIAGFNDYFRDAVKGSGFMRDYSGGYIQNTVNEKYYPGNENGHMPFELLRKTIKGMIGYIPKDQDKTEWQETISPLNSLNYIDCHDGYTLFDKLVIAEYCNYVEPGKQNSPKKDYPSSETNSNIVDFKDGNQFPNKNIDRDLIKMNNLGAAILLTSQGIPFIHAGQELLRQKINFVKQNNSTKGIFVFDSNSNNSSDEVNSIKWENKEKYFDVFKYYQGLIKLRKEHPTFRRTTKKSVESGLIFCDDYLQSGNERCIAYKLVDEKNEIKNEKWKNVIILMNPYKESKKFNIPESQYGIVVNAEKSGTEFISKVKGGLIEVDAISMMVLVKL